MFHAHVRSGEMGPVWVVRSALYACGVVVVVIVLLLAIPTVRFRNEMEPSTNYIYYNFVRRLCTLPAAFCRILRFYVSALWDGELMPLEEERLRRHCFGSLGKVFGTSNGNEWMNAMVL